MSDFRVFFTKCCSFKFWGMNHSPEFKEECRHCGEEYIGEIQTSSFATTNLNTLVDWQQGDCKTCGKERLICEHEQCQFCACKHYCWLD